MIKIKLPLSVLFPYLKIYSLNLLCIHSVLVLLLNKFINESLFFFPPTFLVCLFLLSLFPQILEILTFWSVLIFSFSIQAFFTCGILYYNKEKGYQINWSFYIASSDDRPGDMLKCELFLNELGLKIIILFYITILWFTDSKNSQMIFPLNIVLIGFS